MIRLLHITYSVAGDLGLVLMLARFGLAQYVRASEAWEHVSERLADTFEHVLRVEEL